MKLVRKLTLIHPLTPSICGSYVGNYFILAVPTYTCFVFESCGSVYDRAANKTYGITFHATHANAFDVSKSSLLALINLTLLMVVVPGGCVFVSSSNV